MPTPTANAQDHATCSQNPDTPSKVFIELSSAEMQLFKADMEASRVEASVGSDEAEVAKCWIIMAIALLTLCLIALAFTVVSATRNRYW
jgi:hypothetical protein